MPKNILFESAKHQFLEAAWQVRLGMSHDSRRQWEAFVASLSFDHLGGGNVRVRWTQPAAGEATFSWKEARLYVRGDTPRAREQQAAERLVFAPDAVEQGNREFFNGTVRRIAAQAGLAGAVGSPQSSASSPGATDARVKSEESFHDRWAEEDAGMAMDVRKLNEALTAPEMRFIRRQLGELRGKTLLDVGCGLGEASVYFALEGATVTSLDLSSGMLAAASSLAERNGVRIATVKCSAEDLGLPADARFDVIYAGNLLHHVDVARTVAVLARHLKDDGVLVTWDPVAYNPVINIYRRIATAVRTPDEHPLTLKDIRVFRQHFVQVDTRWFWFATLVVFVIMALVERRDPNRERYWKKVVEESERWAWLYKPLEKLDEFLLAGLPFLRPLCWNVVIVARKPRTQPT
ncbi:MAG: class I SAM-dependent methyltransferase [Verrucomicrobia bacterium]|nr:class I SAM-dependent methyltransferase [Verrucomicrobiota bacterium]